MKTDMPIGCLAPYYGSNRKNAATIGELLAGCRWVGIPFAGGMCEVPHIKASAVVVNDIHRHVINLARIVADEFLGPKLYRRLRRKIFHPGELDDAQGVANYFDDAFTGDYPKYPATIPDEEFLHWAEAYFIAVWMGRSAMAGKAKEFSGNLSVRWSASGGDSAVRYHNAVRGLPAWRRAMRQCSFTCLDFRKFLDTCKDEASHGLYLDPPWVEEGKEYKHQFTERDHRDLAARLNLFEHMRIVLRYGDHYLLRELYPASRWEWIETESRTAGNNPKAEVLIVRRN
jgi:DNA adenine methylase